MDFNLIMSNGCLTLKETIITSANLEHLIGVFYESVLFTTTRSQSKLIQAQEFFDEKFKLLNCLNYARAWRKNAITPLTMRKLLKPKPDNLRCEHP